MRINNIGPKIGIFAVVIVFITALLLSIFNYVSQKENSIKNLNNSAKGLCKVIADTVWLKAEGDWAIGELGEETKTAVSSFFSEAESSEDIEYIVLTDIASQKDIPGKKYEKSLPLIPESVIQSAKDTSLLNSAGKIRISEYSNENGETVYESISRVGDAANTYGILRIGVNTKSANKYLNSVLFKSIFITMIILAAAILFTVMFVRKNLTRPLETVVKGLSGIADDNLRQEEIPVKSNDEIGKLSEVYNTMLRRLKDFARRAELISNGVIGADEADKKMKAGMNLTLATAVSTGSTGDLADTFARMQTELRKLTIQARRIAEDELHNSALSVNISGELGEAFSKMTFNLTEMSLFAERIASGDLTVNATTDTKDKVLTKAFIRMVSNLRELVLKINKEVEQVNSIAASFAVVSEQSSKNSAQLSLAIEQIAKAANEVAQSTQSASSSSMKAQELSKQGKIVLHDMSGKVDAIRNSMLKSVENIKKLSNRSNEILEMTSVITDIADQTNLLSLNAAIEAARAGEAGRGFAVVASEIRKLSDSSQKQSQRISKTIQDILANTKQTQETTEKEAQHVEEGMNMINLVNKMFLEIVEQVDNIAAKMEQIAANAEETSASTEEVSAQAEEQNASMSEIAVSATQLKTSADSLQKSVSIFKT